MLVQHRGWRGCLAVAGVVACHCGVAPAQDEVKVYRTIEINGVPQAEVLVNEHDSGEDFAITVPFSTGAQTVRMYRITTTSETVDIGHITLTGQRAESDPLLVLIAGLTSASFDQNGSRY
ncbi:MAG: hypothetical protein JNK25_09080 [Phycisphaerae bacterium]|nr:hypothetical protein [Phycisphaerae bacterium]